MQTLSPSSSPAQMMEKEEQLRTFAELKDWKQKERKHEWLNRLESAGFPSEEELIKAEKRIQSALKRSRRRDDNAGDVDADETAEAEVPTFPLIDVPDHELDEDSIREKRRQRLLKAGYDARMRAKAEKREERRLAEERRLKDEEERATNLKEWCKARRQEYEETIERIKERKRKRELLADRKSLAAQQRMKSITSLASDSKGGAAAAGGGADGAGARGKRKRGAAAAGAGGGRSRGEGGDDDFGADDEDWAIYRDIQGAEDSEDEEDDEQLLTTLEAKLLQYDEAFSRADTLAARVARKRALTRTFLGGTPEGEEDIAAAAEEKRKADRAKRAAQAGVDDVDEDEEEAAGDQGDGLVEKLAKQHQITLNVERARLTEVFFQPSMAGVDQAGLDDVSEMIVRGFEDEELRRRMVGVSASGRASAARPHRRLTLSLSLRSPRTSSSLAATPPTLACPTVYATPSPRCYQHHGLAQSTSAAQRTPASTPGEAWPNGLKATRQRRRHGSPEQSTRRWAQSISRSIDSSVLAFNGEEVQGQSRVSLRVKERGVVCVCVRAKMGESIKKGRKREDIRERERREEQWKRNKGGETMSKDLSSALSLTATPALRIISIDANRVWVVCVELLLGLLREGVLGDGLECLLDVDVLLARRLEVGEVAL